MRAWSPPGRHERAEHARLNARVSGGGGGACGGPAEESRREGGQAGPAPGRLGGGYKYLIASSGALGRRGRGRAPGVQGARRGPDPLCGGAERPRRPWNARGRGGAAQPRSGAQARRKVDGWGLNAFPAAAFRYEPRRGPREECHQIPGLATALRSL